MTRWSIALSCLLIGGLAGGFVAGPWLHGQVAGNTAVAKELTSYRDIVKTVLPAVVSIESRIKPKPKVEKAPQRRHPPQDDQIPEEFRKFFEEFGRGQLEVPDDVPRMGFGSGFVVDPKGVILTNYHVVGGADQVEVELQDGRKFISKDIHGDRKTDLAIVRIDAKAQLPYLQLGDSSAMEIGDRVLAVGAPFGLTGSVTAGIVSAKGRNGLNVSMYEDFLQTDAAINPGNSGGPLINMEGKVIGINSAIRTRTGGFQGVGLAIASNLAKEIINKLENGGVVHRGYLGVVIRNLDPGVADRLGVKSGGGVVVGQVREGTPAANGGLKDGDIITAVAGKPVKNSRDLQNIVADLPLKKATDLAVVRDGKARTLQVTIEEQPENFDTARDFLRRPQRNPKEADSVPLDKMGMEVTDLTPEKAEQLGYKENLKGALITQVEPGSSADFAGLDRGMVIAKVGEKAVTSAAQAKEALAKESLDKGILLQVQSPQGGTSYVMLKEKAEK
jgi:serine protease Do